MVNKTARVALDGTLWLLHRVQRRLAGRRAGVALILALSAPVLIGATGLAVDIGYWYQQQSSIQSAADAAALAVANAAVSSTAKYNISTLAAAQTFAAGTGGYFAIAAANDATNGQFGFASSGAKTITVTATQGATSSIILWTATANIPRGTFFSGALFSGLAAGNQSAAGEAASIPGATASGCILATSLITQNGNGSIDATNCGVFDSNTAAGSISNTSSGSIIGTSIGTSAPSVSIASIYYGYIGTSQSGGTGDSTATVNAAAETDPLATMGTPPTTWPTMPSLPNTTYLVPYFGYNNGSINGGTCTNGNATCRFIPGWYQGLNIDVLDLTMDYGTTSGSTYVEGGLTGNEQGFLTLNGSYYLIGGPGVTPTSNTPTNWAWVVNTPSVTTGTGQYYINGGLDVNGSNPTMTFGPGFYDFSAYNSSNPAFEDTNSNALTMNNSGGSGGIIGSGGGSTFFFNGGLTIAGNATITLGPGIYYIENGNLNITASGTVTGTGVTFVLLNGAGYNVSGGSNVNLSAPVANNATAPTNCVLPTAFPNASFTTSYPYDGTDGEGICGILIYQARTDTASDQIIEGSTLNLNGTIYAPTATVSISGSGNATITSSALPAIEQASILDAGSGKLSATENNQSSSGSGGGGPSNILLVK